MFVLVISLSNPTSRTQSVSMWNGTRQSGHWIEPFPSRGVRCKHWSQNLTRKMIHNTIAYDKSYGVKGGILELVVSSLIFGMEDTVRINGYKPVNCSTQLVDLSFSLTCVHIFLLLWVVWVPHNKWNTWNEDRLRHPYLNNCRRYRNILDHTSCWVSIKPAWQLLFCRRLNVSISWVG